MRPLDVFFALFVFFPAASAARMYHPGDHVAALFACVADRASSDNPAARWPEIPSWSPGRDTLEDDSAAPHAGSKRQKKP